MRDDPRHPGAWGLPGGKMEHNESLFETITRECTEEMGFMPECLNLVPIEKFTSSDGQFGYHTFFACVTEEFHPTLNYEHIGYAWIASGTWPKPMHPGLWSTVNFDVVQDKVNVIRKQIRTKS